MVSGDCSVTCHINRQLSASVGHVLVNREHLCVLSAFILLWIAFSFLYKITRDGFNLKSMDLRMVTGLIKNDNFTAAEIKESVWKNKRKYVLNQINMNMMNQELINELKSNLSSQTFWTCGSLYVWVLALSLW